MIRTGNKNHWSSFGDSITKQELWQPYVANQYNLIHSNCGIGSTTLAGTKIKSFWHSERLNTLKETMPDIVTILGGANDLVADIPIGDINQFNLNIKHKDKKSFLGAYSYIIEDLLSWKPDLLIILLSTINAHRNGSSIKHQSNLTYKDYADATKKVASFYGLLCVDLYSNSGINEATEQLYTCDGIHPYERGAIKIAATVIDAI